ncbi:MAG: hypothetical protein ACLGSD_16625 [Acidobacteriota bacterium]
MKRVLGCALILGLFSIPGFASSNSKNVNFPDAVTVGTAKLPAGDYKVTWTGAGPDVQVKIVQLNAYHPLKVTVPAKLETAKDGHTGMTTKQDNGMEVVEQLDLNKVTLIFSPAPAQGQ